MKISNFQKNLKESTTELHRQAENHPVMQSFVKGTFKKEHLLRFLVNVKPCYEVVEQRFLQPYIIKNLDLRRTVKLQKDIEAIASTMPLDRLADLLTPYEITDMWVAWCWAKPKEMLKAELYVRWLADLYGGRMMVKSLGEYTSSVSFENPSQTISDIRQILDEPNVIVIEEEIIDDTLKFFDYHIELFKAIEENE